MLSLLSAQTKPHPLFADGDGASHVLSGANRAHVEQYVGGALQAHNIDPESAQGQGIISQIVGNTQLAQEIQKSGLGVIQNMVPSLLVQAMSNAQTNATAQTAKNGVATDGAGGDAGTRRPSHLLLAMYGNGGTASARGNSATEQQKIDEARSYALSLGMGWVAGMPEVLKLGIGAVQILKEANFQKASFDALKGVGFTAQGAVDLAEYVNIHNRKNPNNRINANEFAEKVSENIAVFETADQKAISAATEHYLKLSNLASKSPGNPALQQRAEEARQSLEQTIDQRANTPEERAAGKQLLDTLDTVKGNHATAKQGQELAKAAEPEASLTEQRTLKAAERANDDAKQARAVAQQAEDDAKKARATAQQAQAVEQKTKAVESRTSQEVAALDDELNAPSTETKPKPNPNPNPKTTAINTIPKTTNTILVKPVNPPSAYV